MAGKIADQSENVEPPGEGGAPLPRVRLRHFSRSLPMLLLRARESVMKHFRNSLRMYDLTEQQWRILRALMTVKEIEVTELARATFLLGPSLSRILRDLEARDLISRAQQFEDLRKTLVSLTDYGRKTIAPIEAAYAELGHRLADAVGREAVYACAAACSDVVEQIGARPGDD